MPQVYRVNGNLRMIILISRYLGTFPFDDTFRMSKKWLLYPMGCLFLQINFRLYVVYNLINDAIEAVDTMYRISIALFEVILTSMNAIGPIVYNETLYKFMENLSRLHNFLYPSYRNNITSEIIRFKFVKIAMLVIALCFMVSVIYCICIQIDLLNICRSIMFTLNSLHIICFLLQYTCLLDYTKYYFRLLLKTGDSELTVTLYELIQSTEELIHEYYNYHIFLTVSWCFTVAVLNLYQTLISLDSPIKTTVTRLSWIPVYLLVIIIAIKTSQNTVRQAKKFNEVLYWKMVEDKTGFLQNNEKLNFHFIAKRELCFTACGFFKLDNSLICTMIATATTYLVISLQYGKSGLSPIDYQQLDNRNGSHRNGS